MRNFPTLCLPLLLFIATISIRAAPLSPAESIAAIHLTAGYEIELVAVEPLVQSPVAVDWSPDGRLWVVEMLDYPTGIDGKGKPGGRIKLLADTDGNGKFDKASIVIDSVRMPTGVAQWRDGALVAAAPEIFFVSETGEKRVLFTGFKEGNPQLRVNALRWGLDGWVYCSNGMSGGTVKSVKTGQTLKIDGRDLRIRPDDGAMELVSGMSQYGRDRDDFGNWFGCDNSNPIFHFVLEDRYLRRNLDAPPVDPKRQLIVPANPPVFAVSAAKDQYDRTQASPGHPGHFTSACSPMIYRDDLLFPQQPGVEHAFVCEPVHNLVHHAVLMAAGISFTAARAADEMDREFLASEDPWFRPVMVRMGPDGALWVVDMGRFMVEHPDWLPPGGPQKMAPRFRDGAERGRIYRVSPKGNRRPMPRLDQLDANGLAKAIENSNGWVRDKAQQLIVWGKQHAAAEPLAKMLRESKDPAARIQAMWTLQGIGALDDDLLSSALGDGDGAVRREAVRVAELRPASAAALREAVEKRAGDDDAAVRLQVACTLGEWEGADAGAALGHVAIGSVRAQDQAQYTAAVLSSASRHFEPLVAAVLREKRSPTDPLQSGLLALALARNDRPAMAKLLAPILGGIDGSYRGDQICALSEFNQRVRRRGLSVAKLRDAADDGLAEELRSVPRVLAAARIIAGDDGPVAVRVAAIHLMGAPDELDLLTRLLTPRTPPEVQTAAVSAIARAAGDRAPELLTRDWAGLSPQVRGAVVDELGSHEPWAIELLNQVESGKISATQFDAARRQRLLKNPFARVRELAGRVLQAIETSRAKVVEQHSKALLLPGDAARGAKAFAQTCATCHRLGGIGNDIGPDLRSVSGWEPEALLTAILDPNRQVEPRYLSYTAITNSGETVFGIIIADTAGSITIKGLDGKEQTLPRASLKALEGTDRSLMPEGLEATLSDQDLSDVMRFLRGAGSEK